MLALGSSVPVVGVGKPSTRGAGCCGMISPVCASWGGTMTATGTMGVLCLDGGSIRLLLGDLPPSMSSSIVCEAS